MTVKRKKTFPALDPSMTQFNKYYKGNDGNWYVRGTISFDDPPRDPQVPESVVAEAVYRWNQFRKREAVAKLRKVGKIEAQAFAEKIARETQPRAPFAVDIKMVGQHPDLGDIKTVYRGLVKEYGFSSLEPKTDPFANPRLVVVSRGTSKAYTCKYDSAVQLNSIPK